MQAVYFLHTKINTAHCRCFLLHERVFGVGKSVKKMKNLSHHAQNQEEIPEKTITKFLN